VSSNPPVPATATNTPTTSAGIVTPAPSAAGQPSQFGLFQAQPGQPTLPPLPSSGGLTIQQLYQAMQNYYQPLSQPLNLTAQLPLPDPTMAALAQQFNAVQQANVGSQPSPNSVLAKASSHLTVGEIAGQVGQETWQQMVTDPFNQFIDTWKRDPKAGLLETLGGIAVMGGIAMGAALLPEGAAAAGLFALGAAFVAPGMASAWWDELRNPTDSNLVKALVHTSTGILTVGVPIKWSAGMGISRQGFEAALAAMRDMVEPRGVPKLWISGSRWSKAGIGDFSEARGDVPLGRQMDTLDTRLKQYRQQVQRWFGDAVPEDVKALDAQMVEYEANQVAWKAALDDGDEETAQKFFEKMQDLAAGTQDEKGNVIPGIGTMRLGVAYNYRFLPTHPYKHVPFSATISSKVVSTKVAAQIQSHLDSVLAIWNRWGQGNTLSEMKVMPKTESTVLERHAASLSAGAPEMAMTQVMLAEKKIADLLKLSDVRPTFAAGKEPTDVWDRLSEYEKIEVGLEDASYWKKLEPRLQLAGMVRASMDNAQTVAELKRGTIGVPYAGRVRRTWSGVGDEDSAVHLHRDPTDPMKGKLLSYSRNFQIAFDDAGDVHFNEARSRMEILRDEFGKADAYDPEYVDFLREHDATIRSIRRSWAGTQSAITAAKRNPAKDKKQLTKQLAMIDRLEKRLADLKGEQVDPVTNKKTFTGAGVKAALELGGQYDPETIDKLVQHLLMESKDLGAARAALPPGRRLVTGSRLFRSSVAASIFRLHAADYHGFYYSMANTALQTIRDANALLKKDHEERLVGLLQDQKFLDRIGGKPHFLPATVFRGGTGTGEGVDAIAAKANYYQVAPQIGTSADPHFKPAVYALKDIVAQLEKAHEDAQSSTDLLTGAASGLFSLVSKTKHIIMLSPAWHFMNVAGRMMAFILNDPAIAMPAAKALFGGVLSDPRLRYELATEFWQAGGRAGNKFNVARAIHLNDREENAQSHWPGVIRSAAGALWHPYQTHVEDGFWKMVDDFQLAAYQYAKHHLTTTNKTLPESEVRQLAALYANDLGGMVNPLYMNRMWKHARNLIFFAPSYWATFMRSLLSLTPGADRLSSFLSTYREGSLIRFSAVPLKAVSEIGRRELVRMHRSWALTYLMTAITAADMANVLFGGRHLWENDQGHMFDVNVDKAASLFGQGPVKKGTAVQHTYFSGMPFFRQAMDVANGLGLGHDWGFGHQFSDQTFQQVDAYHKALLLAGGLMQGVEEQGASKTAAPLQAAYGLATGETLSGRARGVQRIEGGPLGRFDALTSFIPGGSAVERVLSTTQQTPQQAAQTIGGSLLQQYTGIPSIYHMGIEQLPIDDSDMNRWAQQRTSFHDTLSNASKQMFAGQIQPIQYERLRQQTVDKMLQLDADTFGPNQPAGALSRVRLELEQANGLNRNDLTDSQWAERNDIFQSEWDQVLSNASPQTKAAWWEVETQQWTDADYLVWEAQQMRQTIMAAIDGQGGQHIRAYQHQIGPLLDIPSTALRTQLEQGDPYYYAYRQALKSLSRSSSLGAFLTAFTSPYSNTLIEPEGMSPEQEQQLISMADTGATILKPATVQALAAQAKRIAQSEPVKESGGKAAASPEFDQTLGAMTEQAAQGS
jgi:hypothetical protein